MGETSDSEQCSNQLQIALISLLVNISCELGKIMTRYEFLWTRRVILSNVRNNLRMNCLCIVSTGVCLLMGLCERHRMRLFNVFFSGIEELCVSCN